MTRRALIGWLLFTLSGLLFFVAGLRDGDALTMITSVIWMLGCVIFLSDRSAEVQPSGQPGLGDQYLTGD